MDSQLQTALADILSKTTHAMSAGANFLQAQLPDVIHQLLVWKMVASAIQCLSGIAILTILVVSLIKLWHWAAKKEEGADRWNKGDVYFPVTLTTIVCGAIFGLLGFFLLDLGWLQILLAPKVYLIEYAAHLARGVQ